MSRSATPNFGPPLTTQPVGSYGTPPPVQPARPPLAQQAPAPRVIRGQQPEEPIPAALRAPIARQTVLRMPSPEELGVVDVQRFDGPNVDWAMVHSQLDRLGVTCFHLERTSTGGYRLTCLLPTNQRDRSHRIEAEAASEADAVRLTLAKAQEWAVAR